MSLRRCFLSVIILLSVVQNVTAMSYLFGENSTFRNMHSFGHAIYQNRIPIGITAATTVLLTSYDKPVVMYSTLALCNLYLLNRCMRSEQTVAHFVSTTQPKIDELGDKVKTLGNDVKEIKRTMNTIKDDVGEIKTTIKPFPTKFALLRQMLTGSRQESMLIKTRVGRLTTKFGTMSSGIEDLNRKHTDLSSLVVTEANRTRELNTANANRVMNTVATIRMSESSNANANEHMATLSTNPPVSSLFNSPLASYTFSRQRTNN